MNKIIVERILKCVITGCALFLGQTSFASSYSLVDGYEFLSDTRAYVYDGKYEKALDRYVFFHKNAKKEDGNSGYANSSIRFSVAVNDFASLANMYPPAMDVLIEIRDDTSEIINKGHSFTDSYQCDIFSDVVAINRAIDDNKNTVSLFKQLDEYQPYFAKRCFPFVESVLLAEEKYRLAAKYLPDPRHEFGQLISETDHQMQRFIDRTLQLIATALSVGNRDVAIEIQAKALNITNDERLVSAI